jgi:hypothetical protein
MEHSQDLQRVTPWEKVEPLGVAAQVEIESII